jgi:hypothetical protein
MGKQLGKCVARMAGSPDPEDLAAPGSCMSGVLLQGNASLRMKKLREAKYPTHYGLPDREGPIEMFLEFQAGL